MFGRNHIYTSSRRGHLSKDVKRLRESTVGIEDQLFLQKTDIAAGGKPAL